MTTTDIEIADTLDLLARAASRLRRLMQRMSPEQVKNVVGCSPWDDDVDGLLIQVDTWAVVAASEVRGVARCIGDLGA